MPLIPAPPAAPDKDTLALRVDRELHDQLRAYAEFLGSTQGIHRDVGAPTRVSPRQRLHRLAAGQRTHETPRTCDRTTSASAKDMTTRRTGSDFRDAATRREQGALRETVARTSGAG